VNHQVPAILVSFDVAIPPNHLHRLPTPSPVEHSRVTYQSLDCFERQSILARSRIDCHEYGSIFGRQSVFERPKLIEVDPVPSRPTRATAVLLERRLGELTVRHIHEPGNPTGNRCLVPFYRLHELIQSPKRATPFWLTLE